MPRRANTQTQQEAVQENAAVQANAGADMQMEATITKTQPEKGVLALAVKVAVLVVVEAVGRILHQPFVVGSGVALHRRHDQRGVGVVQIIGHAPAFAKGGILVKKDVLAVEHIQHRIPAVRVSFIHRGQINIYSALLGAVDSRVAHAPFFDHGSIPLNLSRTPAAMQAAVLFSV